MLTGLWEWENTPALGVKTGWCPALPFTMQIQARSFTDTFMMEETMVSFSLCSSEHEVRGCE